MRTPLSALIVTQNEERFIERCLASLAWVDEIIVVDGGSTDRTLEIVRRPDAPWALKIRVFERPWNGFREQRNFSLDQALHDWVLVVDSDEACSPELKGTLETLLSHAGGPSQAAYKIRRQEYFLGKPIHFGIWNPSYQDRFFRKTGVRYKNDIHEYPVFSVLPGRIHEPLLHEPGFAPEKFLTKMNRYTTIEAWDRVKAGQRTHLIHLIGAAPAMFLKNYFYYSAYKDGMHGLVISVLEGISRAVRHIKIWQFSQIEDARIAATESKSLRPTGGSASP